MSAGVQPARTYSRRSLHGQVAYEIGGRIIRGEFAPGATLPNEADLAGRLSVSRTALREAIKVLAAKGLLESRPRTGTRVRPREHWNMLDPDVLAWQFACRDLSRFATDLFEVRMIIEPAAAALAAERASPAAVAAIADAYAEMVEAGADADDSVEPDLRFHFCILRATGNELLGPLGALIETALATSMRLTSAKPDGLVEALPLHRAVLDAIDRRDPEAARAAMRALLTNAIADMHRAIARHTADVYQPL